MDILNYFILFFSACLGGSLIFLFKENQNKRLKLLLSFSGAYLFSITVLHLLPEVYEGGNHSIGVFILIGFAFQILLEQFSEGIEHGHIHIHANNHQHSFPWGIMISLSLHAFLEGMPLIDHQENHVDEPLLYGIALHHIPAAFALTSVLAGHHLKKTKIFLFLMIFALMTPMGSVFAQFLQANTSENLSQYFNYMMGIVIGIFLHISTTILFESNVDHRFNFYKMIAIVLGASIALLNFFLH
jgi:zinc transporter ZupT